MYRSSPVKYEVEILQTSIIKYIIVIKIKTSFCQSQITKIVNTMKFKNKDFNPFTSKLNFILIPVIMIDIYQKLELVFFFASHIASINSTFPNRKLFQT